MAIKVYQVEVTPVGADGVATATVETAVTPGGSRSGGFLRAWSLDKTSMPATTDCTVYADSTSNAAIATDSNSATDLGNTKIDPGEPFFNKLICKVAQGDAGTTKKVIFYLWVER